MNSSRDSRRIPLQRRAEHRLRPRAGVHVRGVEGGDADVQRGLHAGDALLLLDLAAVGEPVAVSDLADGQTASTQPAKVHGCTLPARAASQGRYPAGLGIRHRFGMTDRWKAYIRTGTRELGNFSATRLWTWRASRKASTIRITIMT